MGATFHGGMCVRVGVFYLALWQRKTGDEPFAIAVRQPRKKSKPKEWLIAYVVACALAGTAVFVFHPWSTDLDAGITSQASKLYASAIALHGGFFFAYMGWTGTPQSRLLYWLSGCAVVAIFAYVVSW